MNVVTASKSTDPFAAINGAGSTGAAEGSPEEMSATFLRLLMTQMQNQDPLNPMDNAQVTSQMAQINTVSGIQQLNDTMTSIAGQFAQMQALQGASLVGREVLVEGNALQVVDGVAHAGFELDAPVDQVKVEVLSSGGRVLDTLQFGAQGAGRHSFEWQASGAAGSQGLTFRVVANSGAREVAATPLVADRVASVATAGGAIDLQLASGQVVPYGAVLAIS